jgi:hypothetical protein
MNKWLFKNIYWLYFLLAKFRTIYFIQTKQQNKAINIINEHRSF